MEDLVKVGDEIETFVVRVNDQEGVVTLSKKRLDVVKGWEDVEAAQEEQTVMEGVVTEDNKGRRCGVRKGQCGSSFPPPRPVCPGRLPCPSC